MSSFAWMGYVQEALDCTETEACFLSVVRPPMILQEAVT
jgi:hypothetical protein